VLTLDTLCKAIDGRKIDVGAVSSRRYAAVRFTNVGLEWRLYPSAEYAIRD
jgi:hypothetical protein